MNSSLPALDYVLKSTIRKRAEYLWVIDGNRQSIIMIILGGTLTVGAL
jgi:hypothetical protein